MLASTSIYAQDRRHILLILRPPSDTVLLMLKNGLGRSLTDVSLDTYGPVEPETEIPPDIEVNLSNGKEAYEFLRFNESIHYLNAVTSGLQGVAGADKALSIIKEAYLYLAMDYLALDMEPDAEKTVNNYLCVSGTPVLDPDLWPPNLVHSVENQSQRIAGNTITVSVKTNPPDSEVFIDGRMAGSSPITINILPCTHFIKIVRQGYIAKKTVLQVNNTTHEISIDLEPDLLITTDTFIAGEQASNVLSTYRADALLFLTSGITETTARTTTWIRAYLAEAQSNTTTSVLFNYTNEQQAVAELSRFLNHKNTALQPLDHKPESEPSAVHQKWYENKWLWAAGTAILAGGLAFSLAQDQKRGPQTTGSIMIKW